MDASERPIFESEASRRIYEYVERHGTAKRHMLLDIVSLSPETGLSAEEFRTELDRLKSKGYLVEEGGTLQLGLDLGAVEERESDSLSFIIRPGYHVDFEGLVDVIRNVTAEETYVVAETVAEQLLYENAVSRHNTVESRIFFIAVVDDEVVGWTHLDLPQIERVREAAQQTVGVVEAYRGHGIGSHLLRRGLEWAEANGYRKVYNSLPITNESAIEFLDSHGWQTEAIRRNHYTIGDKHVDEVMMGYEF